MNEQGNDRETTNTGWLAKRLAWNPFIGYDSTKWSFSDEKKNTRCPNFCSADLNWYVKISLARSLCYILIKN